MPIQATEMTPPSKPSQTLDTPFEQLGGAAGVWQLVRRFHALMDGLPEAYTARSVSPQDLRRSEESLFDFLSGWFGGPCLPIPKEGHPCLRMRHSPYAVGTAQRDAWMQCMAQALTEQVADVALRTRLIETFSQIADHMVNLQCH